MRITSIRNIMGKPQAYQGQVFDTRKHYFDKIGAVPTNLTYGENVFNYISPRELLHTVQSTAKLASKIPIKERQLRCQQREIKVSLNFLVGLNLYVVLKRAL